MNQWRIWVSAASVAVSLATSAEIVWPSDFWNQIAAHDAAVAPVAVESTDALDFSAFSCVREAVVMGTVAVPFDSRRWVEASVDAFLDSNPCGMLLFLR